MNGRVICYFIVACVVFGFRSAAADVVPDPGLPADLKTSSDLGGSAGHQISDAINAEIAKVADDTNPDAQSAARDWLITEATVKDNPSSTSSYYTAAYNSALNTAAAQLLSKPDATARARVNVGVVIARVADHGDAKDLTPSVLLLLKDKNPGVVIWGERAAGNLLDTVLQPGSATDDERKTIFDAIIAGVSNHPEPPLGGIVADEAYRAIIPSAGGRHLNNPQAPLDAGAMQLLVEANVHLQEARLKLYISAIPEWPDADTYSSAWLLSGSVWTAMSNDDRKAALQQASNLITLAGRRAAQRAGAQDSTGIELILVLRHEGSYLQFLANKQLNNAILASAAGSVANLSPTSRAEVITAAIEKIFPAVRDSDPGFSDMQAPPDLPGVTATISR